MTGLWHLRGIGGFPVRIRRRKFSAKIQQGDCNCDTFARHWRISGFGRGKFSAKSPNPGAACKNWKDRGLSKAEQDEIVNKHNQLRQRVASGKETRGKNGRQPPAAYMPNLSWNNELAKIAQKWADQCQPGHDKCRNTDKYAVGQNMAMTMNSGDNNSPMADMVQMWYDEVDLFDNREVSNFQTVNGVGHYTQLIWAKTTEIGCGRIKYTGQGWNNNYLICNYGPAGNYIGQPIYEIKK